MQEEFNSLQDLWRAVKDVWDHGLMGVDIGSLLVGLAIFGFFLIVRGIFSKYVLAKLHVWSRRSDTSVDDEVIDALIPPIRFVPVILGLFIALRYTGADEIMGVIFFHLIQSLIAFTIFWALHRALEPLSRIMNGLDRLLTPLMVRWLFRVMKVLVIFIGAAVILEIWGIAVGPLLAGLGLFGAAIALGAQDLFKNLIGGITVIAEKRFEPGDWIFVDGVVEGVVEDIGFRSTKVRRFDKAPVHVPNANLSDAVVTNFSRMSHRRIKWMIGVEYRTTTEQLGIITNEIARYLQENEAFAPGDEVPCFVRVDSFGPSSIDILVYCFTKTTVWDEWLAIKEQLAFKIKEIVTEKAKTGFAFPSQSLYVEQWPDDTPEMFTPPADKKAGSKPSE